MTHNPCHARRAMASKARPWLGKGTHSALVQFLRRMGSLPVAMLSFASQCDAGNDAVVVCQPTMIPGTRAAQTGIFPQVTARRSPAAKMLPSSSIRGSVEEDEASMSKSQRNTALPALFLGLAIAAIIAPP